MKFITMLVLIISTAYARKEIAVIDSGIGLTQIKKNYICGAVSFVDSTAADQNGHGTNIIGLISEKIDHKTHCIRSYKVWAPKAKAIQVQVALVKALKAVFFNKKITHVNISMSGHYWLNEEFVLLKKILKRGVVVSVAAGNNATDLSQKCDYYPACYASFFKSKNFHVVGAYDLKASNYNGVVNVLETGYKLGFPVQSGTSQATAVHTAKLVQTKKKY